MFVVEATLNGTHTETLGVAYTYRAAVVLIGDHSGEDAEYDICPTQTGDGWEWRLRDWSYEIREVETLAEVEWHESAGEERAKMPDTVTLTWLPNVLSVPSVVQSVRVRRGEYALIPVPGGNVSAKVTW